MDRDRIWAFMNRFVDFAAGAATIGTLAVADRCGLLRTMAGAGPMTSAQVASAGGLVPRYAEEILGQLTTAGVVVYDPAGGTYQLPEEHAAVVADDTSPYSMAGWLDMLGGAGVMLDDIAEAARHGGGVPASEFPDRMVRGVARANGPSMRILLTRRWLPTMPDVVERLEAGARVADVGCGGGAAAITMASAYPASDIVGFDIDPRALAIAEEDAAAADLGNVRFEERSATDLPTTPPFDLVTCFDVVHDLADASDALVRIREALADDGTLLMMEPAVEADLEDNLDPRGSLFYGVSLLFCLTQSLAVGGEGHGAAWGPVEAEALCRHAGFESFRRLPIENPFSAFYEVRP